MKKEILQYNGVRLIDIKADSPNEMDEAEKGIFRVELPAKAEFCAEMSRRGYVFGDRTLGVSINLAKSGIDYQRLVRFEVQETNQYFEDVLRIATASFPTDRRFHVRPEPDSGLAAKIISSWVEKLKSPFVCIHKGNAVGFLYMEKANEESAFITLAAVEERYRSAGAAVSLYAHAINSARGKGYKKVEGRISSGNTAVMNLYAFLGASFSNPRDIYLREARA